MMKKFKVIIQDTKYSTRIDTITYTNRYDFDNPPFIMIRGYYNDELQVFTPLFDELHEGDTRKIKPYIIKCIHEEYEPWENKEDF